MEKLFQRGMDTQGRPKRHGRTNSIESRARTEILKFSTEHETDPA